MVAANYPTRPSDYKKNAYKNFFVSLKYTLPCKKCRLHYCESLSALPVEPFLKGRTCLMMWLYMIHDGVNVRLNRKSGSVAKHFKVSPRWRDVKKEGEHARVASIQRRKTKVVIKNIPH